MKKIAALSALALVIAACSNQTTSTAPAPAPAPTPQVTGVAEVAGVDDPVVVETPVEEVKVAAADPVTVSGGSGGTCLAVDVLANDGAFIRAGTAGTLSGDTFTVDGKSHDMSGINYSTKSC